MLGLLFPFLLALPTLAGPARSAPLPAAPAVVQKPVQKPAATPRTVGRAPQQTPARKPATAAGKTATRGPKASLLTPAPPQGSGAVVQSMVTLGGPVTSIGGTVGWWGNNTFMTATPITAPTLTQRFPTPDDVGLWHLRLVNTPSGWVERFLLVVPENDPATDIPLLVAFHRFGNSMWDIVINTQLPREANARGWYLLAPMGASDISFSSMESQMNTELVLGLVCDMFNVDRQRIYGVGFSMGGGNALNYAARHVDPTAPMFAALVNHTGSLSQRHSYDNDCSPLVGNCQNQWLWEFWYGGPPTTHEFEFLRSSVIDVPYEPGFPRIPPVDPETDLARNLAHLPLQTWMASSDPLPELVVQNLAFANHMTALGAPHTLNVVADDRHTWDNLGYRNALDWLGTHTLTLPTSARTLADRDGRWFHFDLVQDQAGDFSPFEWSIDAASDLIELLATRNVASLTVDTPATGLDTSLGATLTLSLDADDDTGDEIAFAGLSQPPTRVERDGVAVTNWSWDATSGTLRLFEADSGPHVWTLGF